VAVANHATAEKKLQSISGRTPPVKAAVRVAKLPVDCTDEDQLRAAINRLQHFGTFIF
jgi:hypothetical protein